MRQLNILRLQWMLIVMFATLAFQAQAAVFHVLDGEVCTGVKAGCNGSPIECYRSGSIFTLQGGEKFVPMVDSEIGFQNRLGQIKYKELARCSVEVEAGAYDAVREEPEGLIEIVKNLLAGNKKRAQGGKRLKPGLSTLASMPNGDVLLPVKGIVLEIEEIAPDQVQKLEIYDPDSGNVLVEVSRPTRPVVLRAGDLRPGKSHGWAIHTSDKVYRGMFLVLGTNDQREVESEIQTVLKSSQAGPMGQLMMRAAVYHDYGLVFNRDQALKRVKAMQEEG